jgi:hypothetical protein
MKKTAIVLNWLMLGLLGVSFLGLGIQYPGAVGGSGVLILAPYAAALLAFLSGPNRVLIGGGIFLNAVMFLFCLAYVGLGLFLGQSAIAIVVALILLPPPVLNCLVLKWGWDRARVLAQDANKRLQATRETRAPEA